MIEAYLDCAVWKGLFIAAFLTLAVGSILGHLVWGRFRTEGEPWWRSWLGIGHLLRPEYYGGAGGALRAIAFGLCVVGSLLLLVVAGATTIDALYGSSNFCGFQL